jgi:hypothetical protein
MFKHLQPEVLKINKRPKIEVILKKKAQMPHKRQKTPM